MCKITISAKNQTSDVAKFIIDNPMFQDTISAVTNNEDHFNEYTGQLVLNTSSLSPGKYTITLTCTDPIGNKANKSVILHIPEYYRWREIVPVLNR